MLKSLELICRRPASLFPLAALALVSGCSTVYESACHELTSNSRGQLRSMERQADAAQFERHVVLIETGSGMASTCRSYYIDGDEYRGIPESLSGLCTAQQRADSGTEYCMLYYLDGQIVKQRVF